MITIDDDRDGVRCAVKIADNIYTVFENRVEKYDVMDKSWGTVGPGNVSIQRLMLHKGISLIYCI